MKEKPNLKPPDNTRQVLTWVKDRAGLEYWQIDWYYNNGWVEANAFGQKVLYWTELPLSPKCENK
jgi:hypothetical protein